MGRKGDWGEPSTSEKIHLGRQAQIIFLGFC